MILISFLQYLSVPGTCPIPPLIPPRSLITHGCRPKDAPFPENTQCEYHCPYGYVAPDLTFNCKDGRWSPPRPSKIQCKEIRQNKELRRVEQFFKDYTFIISGVVGLIILIIILDVMYWHCCCGLCYKIYGRRKQVKIHPLHDAKHSIIHYPSKKQSRLLRHDPIRIRKYKSRYDDGSSHHYTRKTRNIVIKKSMGDRKLRRQKNI